MYLTIEPTEEMYNAPINGQLIPIRIWHGYTEGGIAVEAYVLAIGPDSPLDATRFGAELPAFMKRSHEMYDIDTSKP